MKFTFKQPRSLLGRIFFWGVPAVLVILLCGFFYIRSWLNAYLQSEDFRKTLGKLTSKQLNAKCEYEPFHFAGLTINADAFKAQGTQKAAFSTLELDKIHTALVLGALWHKSIQIDEVSIQRFQVSLGHTGAPPVPESEIGVEPEQPKASSSTSYAWLTPKLDLRKVVIHDTNVLWGEKTPQAGSVAGTELTLKPDGSAYNIQLLGGTISQKGAPDLKLDHIDLRYDDPTVTISQGLLQFPSGGTIALDGKVNTQKNIDVNIKIAGIPLKPFLPPSEESKLKGVIFADLKVTSPMPVEGTPEVAGSGHLENGEIDGVPGLDTIAKVVHSPSLERVKLNRASADFVYSGQKITVTNMIVESKGLVCLEGSFVINNSRINGNFQVGLPHDLIKWLPFLESQVFTSDHAGYRWAPMHVSGPLSSPEQDLTKRIETALLSAPLDVAKDAAKQLEKAPDAVKDLGKLPDAPKKALDGLLKGLHK